MGNSGNHLADQGEIDYNKEVECKFCGETRTKTRAKCGECQTIFDTTSNHLRGIGGGNMVKCPHCKNADIGWVEVCENCGEERK